MDSADNRAKAESTERRRIQKLRAECAHNISQFSPERGAKLCCRCGQKLNDDHRPI